VQSLFQRIGLALHHLLRRPALGRLGRAPRRPFSDFERRQLRAWAASGPGPLVIFQVRGGSGAWPDEPWLELGDRLQGALGARLAFTGRRRDATGLAALAAALPGARSLAGCLDHSGFQEMLRRAQLVVTADPSVAAAARTIGTPCLYLAATFPDAHAVFAAAERLLLPHLGHLDADRVRTASRPDAGQAMA
jgi:ADP-heptose:LPS heptosyltransferase